MTGMMQVIIRLHIGWRSSGNELFIPSFPPDTNVDDRYVDDIKKSTVDGDRIIGNNFRYYKDYVTDVNKRTYNPSYKPNAICYTKYFDDWQPYTAGKDIEIPIFKDYGVTTNRVDYWNGKYYDVYWQPPITLCFKDNCGNLNYILCTRPDWQEYSSWVYRIHVSK